MFSLATKSSLNCVCVSCQVCRSVTVRLPLGAVVLTPAGHRVADAGAGARVHVLDHDEGVLLQRGHSQVTVVGHFLQVAAVARPDRVANLKDPTGVRTDLGRKKKNLLT